MLAAGRGFKSRPDRGVKGKRLRRLKKTLDIEIRMQVYGRWLLFSLDRSGGLIYASEKRRETVLPAEHGYSTGKRLPDGLYCSAAGRRNRTSGAAGRESHRTSLPLQLGISRNYPEPREI